MTKDRYCVVPRCSTGLVSHRNVGNERKPHLFKVPANKEMLLLWQQAFLHFDRELTPSNAVCSLHFKEEDILRFYETLMPDGTIHKIERGRVALKQGSVPCIFSTLPPNNQCNSELKIEPSEELTCNNVSNHIMDEPSIENHHFGDHQYQKLITTEEETMFNEIKSTLLSIQFPNRQWSGAFVCGKNVLFFTEFDDAFRALKRIVLHSDLSFKIFFGNTQVDMEDREAIIASKPDLERLLSDVNKMEFCKGIEVYSSSVQCSGVICAKFNENNKAEDKCFSCRVEAYKLTRYKSKINQYKRVKTNLHNISRKHARLESKVKRIKQVMHTYKKKNFAISKKANNQNNIPEGFDQKSNESNDIAIETNFQTCRLCGEETSEFDNIFSDNESSSSNLMHLINLHLPIRVTTTDGLSQWSCVKCANNILAFDEMVSTCVQVNNRWEELCQSAEKDENTIISHEILEDSTFTEPEQATEDECEQLVPLQIQESQKMRRKKVQLLEQSSFKCRFCGKTYTRNADLKRHLQVFHHLDKSVSEERRKDKEIIQRCKYLGDDSAKVTFKCDICEKSFPRAFTLLRHYTIHTDTRNYCCHLCGLSFRVYFTLAQHIKARHEKVKDFKCELCGHEFALKTGLDEHMNVHTNNRPFVCDVCGKAFRQRSSFYVHMQSVHVDDANYKYSCEYCGKKFCKESQLKVHERVHTGVKPFKCSTCNTEFRYRGGLRQHVLKQKCQLNY